MKKFGLFFTVIFICGYFLRVMNLHNNALTFGYDQARDAVHALQISRGDLQILGPSSSTPGLYHGVLYFYLLAPAYFLGGGNPLIAAYWIAFLNMLTLVTVLLLTYAFTKRPVTVMIAAILYAVSFEAIQYATWLSNPTIGMLTVPLIYLSLWYWIQKHTPNKYWLWPLLTGLAVGASVQVEIFLAYHLVPVLLWLFVYRKSITKRQLVVFIISLLLAISTLILSEIKFGFKGFAGITSLLQSNDALVASKGFGDFIVLFLNQLGRVYANTTYPGNVGYGAAIVLVCLFIALRESKGLGKSWHLFLVSWLLSHITVTSLGGTSTPFLLVGISPAVCILLAIYIDRLAQKKYTLVASALFLFVLYGNLTNVLKESPRGSTIFAIQKDMILSKQLPSLDYMYKEAGGQPFSVNSLTSPLWVNIVWSYLFDWYGKREYGYVPTWHGRGQEGQVIALPVDIEKTSTRFLIIEPLAGIPLRYLDETVGQENSQSTLLIEQNFGEIVIQKRLRI